MAPGISSAPAQVRSHTASCRPASFEISRRFKTSFSSSVLSVVPIGSSALLDSVVTGVPRASTISRLIASFGGLAIS